MQTLNVLKKSNANEYLQNIKFLQSNTLTASGKRRLRKRSELDKIEDNYDSKRAMLYSAARSEAITTVNKIERKLRSQLEAFDQIGNQYSNAVRHSIESTANKNRSQSVELGKDLNIQENPIEPSAAERKARANYATADNKTIIINGINQNHRSELRLRVQNDLIKQDIQTLQKQKAKGYLNLIGK